MLPYEDEVFDDRELRLEIKKESFENRFGKDYTYEILIKHENTTPEWENVFNSWKERGIIQ